MKNFFGITENKYKFEWMDIFTILTILNVTLVLLGFWWAPIIGIVSCFLNILLNIKNRAHINAYIMQVALLILNSYFLTL